MKRRHYDNFLWREKGEKKRECQDFVFFDPSLDLAVVCDGFGERGALASTTAALRLQSAITKHGGKGIKDNSLSFEDMKSMFTPALHEVNDYLRRTESGSTTITGVMFGEDSLYGFSVGDSRIYGLTKDDQLKRLTEDEAAGVAYSSDIYYSYSEDEYELVTDDRQGPANYLGKSDFFLRQIIKEDISSFSRILLTTDGIKKRISEKELCHILSTYQPDEALEKIREKVYRPLDMIIAMIKHTSSHQDFREQLSVIPAIAELNTYLEQDGIKRYMSELDKFIAENIIIADDTSSKLTKDEREQVVDIVLNYRRTRSPQKGVMDDLGFIIIDLEHSIAGRRNSQQRTIDENNRYILDLKKQVDERIPPDEVARQLADKKQEVRQEFVNYKSQHDVENAVRTAVEITLKEEKEAADKVLEEKLQKYQTGLSEKEEEYRGLNDQFVELEHKLTLLTAEKDDLCTRYGYREQDIVSLQSRVEQKDKKITDLNGELDDKKAECERLKIENTGVSSELDRIAKEKKVVEVRYAGYKSLLESTKAEIDEVKRLSEETAKAREGMYNQQQLDEEVKKRVEEATKGLHDDVYVQQKVDRALEAERAERDAKVTEAQAGAVPVGPVCVQGDEKDIPSIVNDDTSELTAAPVAEALDDIINRSGEEITYKKNKGFSWKYYLAVPSALAIGVIGVMVALPYISTSDENYSQTTANGEQSQEITQPTPTIEREEITIAPYPADNSSAEQTWGSTKRYACARDDTHQVLIMGGDGKYYEISIGGKQSQTSIQPTVGLEFDVSYDIVNMSYVDCEATAKRSDRKIVLNEHIGELRGDYSKLFRSDLFNLNLENKKDQKIAQKCVDINSEYRGRFYHVGWKRNNACTLKDTLQLALKNDDVITVSEYIKP